MVGPIMLYTLVIHPPISAQIVSPGPAIAAVTYHMMADDGDTSVIYTLVIAILVGGAVQSAIAIWLWERLFPKRSTPTDAATIHMAVPTPTDAIRTAVPPPTSTPTPTAPTHMMMMRSVATQSQTTYKWWWSQPRFVPLAEHAHGVGLTDPFFNPHRG